MDNSKLTPSDLAIRSFGGVRALARQVGCDPSAVSRWRKTGLIPASYQQRILEKAWHVGIDLTAHDIVFGRME